MPRARRAPPSCMLRSTMRSKSSPPLIISITMARWSARRSRGSARVRVLERLEDRDLLAQPIELLWLILPGGMILIATARPPVLGFARRPNAPASGGSSHHGVLGEHLLRVGAARVNDRSCGPGRRRSASATDASGRLAKRAVFRTRRCAPSYLQTDAGQGKSQCLRGSVLPDGAIRRFRFDSRTKTVDAVYASAAMRNAGVGPRPRT